MRFSPQIDADKSKRSDESLILTLYDNNSNIDKVTIIFDETASLENLSALSTGPQSDECNGECQ